MKKNVKGVLIILAFISIIIIATKSYATTGKVNQETIRLRKEASTNSGIVTLISLNEEVEIVSEENEWYKVKYKTYTGYIRKDMLTVDGKTNVAETKNENVQAENTVSSSENTSSENTQTENQNAENINQEANNVAENQEQASNTETLQEVQKGYTGKISSKIELKLVPSITSSDIYDINENSQITVKDVINKWSYIETENKSGWTLTSKIKIAQENVEENKTQENTEQPAQENKEEEKKVEEKKEESKKNTEVTKYVSAETLNMREKADNNAKLVSQLKVNTKVTVVETAGTWSKIKVNGKTGYVASKYLSDKKVDITSRSEEITRGTDTAKNESSKTESTSSNSTGSSSGSGIVACAKKYLGCKYVSGGSSPSTGFDCSGFTSYVYKQCGISISRSSGAQASNGTAVSKSNLQPGDLVIFNNRANNAVGHVGIYIGGNTFIHAGNSGTGVITTSLSDSYYSKRYVTARRIIN